MVTHFHNAACLEALLKNVPRLCPVHGFRDLGTLWWKPAQYGLVEEDNQFCPCPPHPWRSFVLSKGPPTWEDHHAARKAWEELPPDPTFDFQEEKRRTDEVINGYLAARRERATGFGLLGKRKERSHVDTKPIKAN